MNRRGIILALLLAVLCLVLCSGCGEKILSGEVVEYRTDESGALSALVVKPETGERVGFLLSEESWVWALTEGITAEEFAAEQPEGVYVSAETAGRAQTITAGDGTEIDAYPVETVRLTALRTDTVFSLSDGARAILWSNGRYWSYRLEDGTELLWEDGSAEVPSGNLQANTDLSEEAKVAIRSVRRDAMEKLKEMKKSGDITEDDLKQAEKKTQDLTDKYVKNVDECAQRKEKEIMAI